MTVLRTFAIIFIFFCTAIAWVILGGTLVHRTNEAEGAGSAQVGELWGTEQWQRSPRFYYLVKREITYQPNEPGGAPAEGPGAAGEPQKRVVEEPVYLEAKSAAVNVSLNLQHRKKGLLWFSTYVAEYRATYRIANETAEPREIHVAFTFPATNALYDNFTFRVKDADIEFPGDISQGIDAKVLLAPGEQADVAIGYKSPGVDRWVYSFGDGVARVRDFTLNVDTDFDDVDFPEGCISPTQKEKTDDGWRLTWKYTDLLTGYQLGVAMPKKLNPGPMASRMSFFAPVSLLFFFTVLFITSAVRSDRVPPLHPMNYFFLAAAFFAFHLLFAYLADHLDIHLTFAASSVVSCFLVFVYVALARKPGYAVAYATFPQIMFLILFSYAFFFPGYTGLIITIGAIVTLATLMIATARVDWASKFAAKKNK